MRTNTPRLERDISRAVSGCILVARTDAEAQSVVERLLTRGVTVGRIKIKRASSRVFIYPPATQAEQAVAHPLPEQATADPVPETAALPPVPETAARRLPPPVEFSQYPQ
ncbi:MAG: hypothetical protein KF861_11055 [Planctomycetaceae bacterium]|nr:hypothetical protein [Planctomycetaceae bacterium]